MPIYRVCPALLLQGRLLLFIGTPLYAYGYAYKYGTTLVSSLTVSTNAASTSDVYTYTYNNLGYITNVKKNGTTVASYSYDSLGQLISESNAATGEIYIYTYDKAGNITKKDIYVGDIGNLTDTITYTYGNTAWKDRLTNYDGTAITYDSIGNPTKWIGIAALTWKGRQLTYLSEDGLDHGVAFTYNADGVRTKKTFYDYDGSVTTHNYVLDGTNIISETVTDESDNSSYTLYYVYDENGHVTGLHYNNQPYYFQKNMQGDILRILDKTGTAVVEYVYDAWGNILSTAGSMASTLGQYNSFRYRGYYYDSETSFYYLESRYYDPAVGRFINADVYVSTGEGIRGYNMFAYCLNNPVTRTDSSGADSFSETLDEDNKPMNDVYHSSGGGGIGGTVNSGGTGSTTTSSTISGSGSGGTPAPSSSSGGSAFIGGYDGSDSSDSSTVKTHGNSKNSSKIQHVYAIYNTAKNIIVKVGISGQGMNLNGTSPRANPQVNRLNLEAGAKIYVAIILETDIHGRSAALDAERKYSDWFRANGEKLPGQKRP